MKSATIGSISLGLLLAFSSFARAEVVGRVLVSVGDNAALRKGQELKLVAGATVETGDTLRIGDASNLQVRFTDEAIMALRPNTVFRIDDYAFASKAESDKSVFSLLRGGVRTITGLIGRNSRSNYSLKTETSTIGIRGTHYTVLACNDDCKAPDGSLAVNGTYGGVTDGRIAAINQAGEREFGKDEYFFVASATTLPQQLLSPPLFLRDRLEGRAKSPGKGAQTPAAKETAADGSASSSNVSSSPQPIITVPTQLVATVAETAPSAQPSVVETVVTPFAGYTDFVVAGVLNHASRSSNTILLPEAERAAEVARLQGIYPVALALSDSLGYSAAAGEARWGHWFGSDGTLGGNIGEHWIVGVPAQLLALPTSGSYAYNWVGGTNPTDNFGNVGVVNWGGQLSLDFTARSLSTVSPLQWTVGGYSYTLSVNGNWLPGSGDVAATLGCTDCTSGIADVSAQFTGNSGEGLIAGIYTTADYAGGITHNTGSAQAYLREAPAPAPTPSPTPTPTPSATTSVESCTSYPCSIVHNYVDAGVGYASSTFASGSTSQSEYAWASGGLFEATYSVNPSADATNTGVASSNYTTTAETDIGSHAAAGNLTWKRYSYTSETTMTDGSHYQSSGTSHTMMGDPVTAMPISGSYLFAHVGGTQPTDRAGNVGTLTSGGSWSVDFGTRTIGTATPVTWSVGGVAYTMSVPSQAWATTSYSYTDPAGAYSLTSTSQSGTLATNLSCSPACIQLPGYNGAAPWFFGAQAEGLGAGYATSVSVGGAAHYTAHVQAYKR